jgi:toxin CcdB
MAQFTIYQNKNAQSKKQFPFLLDVQTNLLDLLQTTVVIPLAKYETNKDKALNQLMPTLTIEGTDYLMVTPQLAGISKKELGKAICDVEYARTDIINAIDFLVTGI